MEILGLGSDVVECVRIRAMIDRHGEAFLARAYTDREIRFCQARRQSTEHFARIWTAKEAVIKCLSGIGAIHRRDIEIRTEADGVQRVILHAAARDRAEELRIAVLLLTASHCRAFATATAIALGRGGAGN